MINTVIEEKTEIIKFTVTESKKFKQSGMKKLVQKYEMKIAIVTKKMEDYKKTR